VHVAAAGVSADGRRRTVSFASAAGGQVLQRAERSAATANPEDHYAFLDGRQDGNHREANGSGRSLCVAEREQDWALMGIKREYHVSKTIAELCDKFGEMASKAPEYEGIYQPLYEPHDGPAGEFAATRAGLANVRSELGERAYEYFLARVDENWQRLQTGRQEELRQLKLSFGEMSHFLYSKKYKSNIIIDELVQYTDVR
jgi:hypothetical protein